MKKENIITIIIVIFVVLLGILYVQKNKKQDIVFTPTQQNEPEIQQTIHEQTIHEQTTQEDNQLVMPEIPQTPFVKKSCQKFIDEYTCQEGTLTGEGLVNCNPQYFRVKSQCQQFIDGIADEYGKYIENL